MRASVFGAGDLKEAEAINSCSGSADQSVRLFLRKLVPGTGTHLEA